MGLYSEVFNFWGKDKIKKYIGLCLGFFFYIYSICSLYLIACTFAPISKFEPLPSKHPRCVPAFLNCVLPIVYKLFNIGTFTLICLYISINGYKFIWNGFEHDLVYQSTNNTKALRYLNACYSCPEIHLSLSYRCKHVVYTTIVNFQMNIVYRRKIKNRKKKKKKKKLVEPYIIPIYLSFCLLTNLCLVVVHIRKNLRTDLKVYLSMYIKTFVIARHWL